MWRVSHSYLSVYLYIWQRACYLQADNWNCVRIACWTVPVFNHSSALTEPSAILAQLFFLSFFHPQRWRSSSTLRVVRCMRKLIACAIEPDQWVRFWSVMGLWMSVDEGSNICTLFERLPNCWVWVHNLRVSPGIKDHESINQADWGRNSIQIFRT